MSVTRKIWPQIASRVATARPMSVAAVTSPYPKVVRVVNEKYCRSGMLARRPARTVAGPRGRPWRRTPR